MASAALVWYDRSAMNDVFRTVGRASRLLSAVQVREIDECDIALLQEEKGSKPPALKRLSERHHALARCLAGGMEESAAGEAPRQRMVTLREPL